MHSIPEFEVNFSHTKLRLVLPNTLYVYLAKDYFYTLNEAKEICAGMLTLTKGEKVKALLIAADGSDCDSETRKYITSQEITVMLSALALVSTSLAQDLLGNFIISFDKPSQPTKLFRSEEKALKWLKNI